MLKTPSFARAAVAAAVLSIAACAPSPSDDAGADGSGGEGTTAVTVSMITSLSGPLAAYGKAYQQGFESGWDHVTDGSGDIDGLDVTFDWKDDQGNPDTAVNLAKDSIGKSSKIMAGTASSGIATALAEQAEQNKVLYISGPAATDAMTGANDYTFRSGRQTYQDVATAGTFLDEVEGKKVIVFAQDNVFGQGNVAGVEAVLGGKGADVSSVLVAEDATEFTPFATQIKAAKPDLVFVAWAGATTQAMWEALGQQEVLSSTTVVTGLGDVASYQAYGGTSEDISFLNHYFAGASETEAATAMEKHITEAGGTPDLFSPDGFVAAQMVHRALSESPEDVEGMISALEGWEFESVKGNLTVRAEDHALLQPMYQAKLVKGEGGTWAPELIEEVDAESVAPPVAGK